MKTLLISTYSYRPKNKAHNDHLSNPQSQYLKEQFHNIRAETQRALRTMENTWWTNKATDIQNHADTNNTHCFYEAVKLVYGPQKRNSHPVRSADGSTLHKDKEKILGRWAEHFNGLLNQINPTAEDILESLPILPQTAILDALPTFQEVLAAIKQLKNNKSAGLDGIPAEIYKQGGYMLHLRIHKLILLIWQEKDIPQDLKDAIIVTIFKKKGDKAVCGNSRGISLLVVAGKILAKVMLSRLLKHLAENILPETQCSFRKDRSTTDMIFVARQL